MTNFVISSGHALGHFHMSSGDTMWVLSGGTASATLVSSGGREIVSSGGASLSDTVLSGGLEVLYAGATGSDTTVSSGGTLSGGGMLSGSTTDLGLISGVSIVSGMGGFGSMTVGSLGLASGVTVNDSFAFVQSGGTARNLLAVGGGVIVVSAGGSTTGTILGSGGDSEQVFGVAHSTVISTGDLAAIFAGGLAIGTVISNGGSQLVGSGGVASGSVVVAGGTEAVLTGGTAIGAVIGNGGFENISSGGIALSSFIASGGNEDVLSGGVATGFAISSGGDLTVASGGVLQVAATGSSTNLGQIEVQSSAEMDLAGTLVNRGVVVFENANVVDVTAAKATLTGSGVINLTSSVLITGLAASDVLDNESDTIEGTGQIGGDKLTVINRGTIDENLPSGMTLNATALTNTGLIEATNAGAGLSLFGPINNSGGVIDANGGGIFLEAGSTISGGALAAAGAGVFTVAGAAALDGTGQALTNRAEVDVGDGTQLTLSGAIDNAGEISLGSVGDNTDLVIGASVTLTGSGAVLMGDAANNRIIGAATASVLDNVNDTIEGAGQVGAGQLILVNSGTIDANGAAGSLQIDPTSATNTGLMESTGSGGLVILTTVNNSGGVISANDGAVYLEDGAVIAGGTLASSPLSRILVANVPGDAVTLNGTASPLTNTGDIFDNDASQLDLIGAIANAGVISLNATADFTDLVISGPGATLTGGGTVELTDSSDNRIYGAAAADKLTNVDNTIEGGGLLGNGQLTLVNSGTIDATGASSSLVLNATSTVNTGLLESTGVPGLVIESVVRNSGGVIAANGGGVFLDAGAVISGGRLSATDFAYFFVGGSGATLSGTATSQLTNSATVFVEDGQQLDLAGAIVNDGIISLNSTVDATGLFAPSANVTLTGSGSIELTDSASNRITGAVLGDVFDNESNTIEGGGEIGGSQLTLINRGTIDATGTAAALRIDAAAVTNTGLMESTNTAGLLIEDTVRNAGGVIAANTGAVFLDVATISGGVLSSTGGGVIYDQGVVTLDGTASQLSNTGSVSVDDGVQLFLAGAIANAGSISLNAGADNTDLVISAASVTLTGTGAIVLSDSADNRIYGAAPADVLDNEGNTIEGAGQIGVGQLTLINRGTIDASGATNSLVIDTTSATNSGLMEATTAPGLVIESVIKNAGGVIGAFGGDVLIQHGAAVSGGLFKGQGGGNDQIEVMSGGSVLGASVGDGAVEIVSAGAIQSGVSVLAGGTELVQSGASVSATVVQSGGVETMSPGAVTSGGTVLAGGVLQGLGSLRGVIVDQGLVSGAAVGSGGVLDVSSGGQATNISVRSGGQQVVFSGGADLHTAIASGGVEALSGGAATSAVVSNGAILRVSSGGVASAASVDVGGIETVFGGGVTRGTILSGGKAFELGVTTGTVVLSGGTQIVASHGTASGAVVKSGGAAVVSSGATDLAATLSGGLVTLVSGGTASGALVSSGGVLRVSSGGVASATTVVHGGTESIFAGGVAVGTVMSGGGELDAGVASGTQVRAGGEEVVEAHGTASGSVISSGGVAIVSSGGMTVAATVSSGGTLTVSSGGAISGGLTLQGGRAVISGTMGSGQTATFAGPSAVLELDNLPGFQAKISGMASATQQVDLGGFTFGGGETVGWAQSGTSGTLTVTDGAKVAHLTLIGTYTSSSFHLTNDGDGGTFVADPRPAGLPPSAAGFAQAIAGLPTDPTAFVGVHGGGTMVMTAPSFVTAATSGR